MPQDITTTTTATTTATSPPTPTPTPPAPAHGVQFNAPPIALLPSITAEIDRAIATLPNGANGALVGVGNASGVNVAVVGRPVDRLEVVAWIGKTWKGSADYGATVRATW